MIVTNQEIRLYASEIVERTTNTADQINSGTRDILITLQKRKKCATTKSAENASSLEYLYNQRDNIADDTITTMSALVSLNPGLKSIVSSIDNSSHSYSPCSPTLS